MSVLNLRQLIGPTAAQRDLDMLSAAHHATTQVTIEVVKRRYIGETGAGSEARARPRF